MTDFEERLMSALRSAESDAPDATGLADAARSRRSRRRRTTALTSAAAVGAVVAVVGGVALLGSGGEGTPDRMPVAGDPTTAPTTEGVVAGPPVRVETWRDLSLTVPKDWGYGNLSTWCLNGKREPGTPVVERPGGTVESIACNGPQNGYGVQFLDGSLADMAYQPGELWQYEPGDVSIYPDGAWLGYQRAGDNLVLVVTDSRPLTDQILSSFQRVTDVDANGCARRMLADGQTMAAAGTLRLCRYSADGWLEQSETLDSDQARQAVEAMESAPTASIARCTVPVTADVLMATADYVGQLDLQDCPSLTWAGEQHVLTADVLYWLLSPGWSGQIPDGITMGKLRR